MKVGRRKFRYGPIYKYDIDIVKNYLSEKELKKLK